MPLTPILWEAEVDWSVWVWNVWNPFSLLGSISRELLLCRVWGFFPPLPLIRPGLSFASYAPEWWRGWGLLRAWGLCTTLPHVHSPCKHILVYWLLGILLGIVIISVTQSRPLVSWSLHFCDRLNQNFKGARGVRERWRWTVSGFLEIQAWRCLLSRGRKPQEKPCTWLQNKHHWPSL